VALGCYPSLYILAAVRLALGGILVLTIKPVRWHPTP
jgi:hypothetical protein